MTYDQADVGQVARALQVPELTAQQNDECVSGSSSCVGGNPQDVQVMNDLIGDPGQERPSPAPPNSPAVTPPAGADSLRYFSAISIADLSHAGAESLLGVSIFNYLTPPISATLSPL